MSDVELRALEREVRQGEPVPDARLLAAWLRGHGDEDAKRTPMPGDCLTRGRMRRLVVHHGTVVWGQVLEGGSTAPATADAHVLHVVGPTARWVGDGVVIDGGTLLPIDDEATHDIRDRAAQALRFPDLRWLMTGDPFRGCLRSSWRKWAKGATVECFGCPRCLGAGYRYVHDPRTGVPIGSRSHEGWRTIGASGASGRLLLLAAPDDPRNATEPCPDCHGTGWGFSPAQRSAVLAAVTREAKDSWNAAWWNATDESAARDRSWQATLDGYPRAPLPGWKEPSLFCVCDRTGMEPIPPGRTCGYCGFPAPGTRTGTLRASWNGTKLAGLQVVGHTRSRPS